MTALPENVAELNGGAPLGNPEVVRLLEATLAEARAGRLPGVAVVRVRGPGAMEAQAAGGFMAELFMGCAMIQDAIKGQAAGKRSPILRLGG